MLQLAETIVRLTGSSSPIVFEALPVDDPQVRRPDIAHARNVLGWEPEIDLDEGLRRWLVALGHEPLVAYVEPASSPHSRRSSGSFRSRRRPARRPSRGHCVTGIFDDAHIVGGDPSTVFSTLTQLRVRLIRVTLWWGGATGVARGRPATAERSRPIRHTTGMRTTASSGPPRRAGSR